MKSLIEQYREEFHGIEYCCYCMEPKDNKYSCCQENHFIPFQDFDDKDQIQMIEDEIYWTEKLAKLKEAKNGR